MEITASSVYDLQSTKHYLRTNQRHVNRFLLIFGILYLIMGIVALLTSDPRECLSLFCISFLMLLLLCFNYFISYRLVFRRMKLSQNLKNGFLIRPGEIEMTSCGSGYNGNGRVSCSALYRIVETKGYYYLYINRGQAYILDKSTVSGGTENDLRSLLTGGIDAKKYRYLPKRP